MIEAIGLVIIGIVIWLVMLCLGLKYFNKSVIEITDALHKSRIISFLNKISPIVIKGFAIVFWIGVLICILGFLAKRGII